MMHGGRYYAYIHGEDHGGRSGSRTIGVGTGGLPSALLGRGDHLTYLRRIHRRIHLHHRIEVLQCRP